MRDGTMSKIKQTAPGVFGFDGTTFKLTDDKSLLSISGASPLFLSQADCLELVSYLVTFGMTGTLPKNEIIRHALVDITKERQRQDKKWGIRDHHPIEWSSILFEEVGETSTAVNEFTFNDGPIGQIKEEVVQVAAVAVAIYESLGRIEAK